MLNKDILTIKLNKTTAKKLNDLKNLGIIKNMTKYSLKILAEQINKDYAELQRKVNAK